MQSALSTDALSSGSVTNLRQEEIVIALLSHCRSMKRQETRFRLATGFMLLVGFVVICFLPHLKRMSTSDEAGMGAQGVSLAQAQHDPRPKQEPGFRLIPIRPHPNNTTPMQWRNPTNRQTVKSLRIPTDGLYFVSLRMSYRIPDQTKFCEQEGAFEYLSTVVMKSKKTYPKDQKVVSSLDTMTCTYPNHKSVYTGRFIPLTANDELKVMVYTKYELIDWYRDGVSFDVFLF